MVDRITLQSALQASVDKEIAERTQAHQEEVARLLSAAKVLSANGVAGPQMPLSLLAHGDSWFDYPLDGNSLSGMGNTDVIAHLSVAGVIHPLILNLSHYGDATTDEMGLSHQERMITALNDPDNWPTPTKKPDAILFSGGGNDIVGEQFCIFLNYYQAGASGLDMQRFQEKLQAVAASYRDLFAFRDRYAPGVPIFAHTYDFAIPDGRHPPCAGPWLKPSLDFAGWTVAADCAAIVRLALQEFQNVLSSLAAVPANNFALALTQGTLTSDEWANELHPTSMGFADIAERMLLALRTRFPGRI
ncbi:MAG TPA: hypothetical protein VGR92_04335 [Steroidobacteraceae bacterium]|nr:hypothetical protein [Steroidobacteraceae bacterium]